MRDKRAHPVYAHSRFLTRFHSEALEASPSNTPPTPSQCGAKMSMKIRALSLRLPLLHHHTLI